VPEESNGAWYKSGVRFGTPALTDRFGAGELDEVAERDRPPRGDGSKEARDIDVKAKYERASDQPRLGPPPVRRPASPTAVPG